MKQNDKKILHELGLSERFFTKSESGFTNLVYLSKVKVLKIFNPDKEGLSRFESELYIYENLNIPFISKKVSHGIINNTPYLYLERGQGKRVYEVWHKLDDQKRAKIIRQLSMFMKELEKLPKPDHLNEEPFFPKIINNINNNLNLLEGKIDPELKGKIITYTNKIKPFLTEDKKRVVYRDLHFDNILIDDNANITTIFDFEDISYAPLYLALDTINRMCDYPYLYANEHDEKNAVSKDYKNIISILKETNKNLFETENLDKKLSIISLDYDLKQFIKYYRNKGLKDRIEKDIGGQNGKR